MVTEDEVLANATDGLTLILTTDLLHELLRNNPLSQTPAGEKSVTLLLPSTSKPTELVTAQLEFNSTKLKYFMQEKFPNQGYKIRPIPVYSLVGKIYSREQGKGLKELSYEIVNFDLTAAFLADRKIITNGLTAEAFAKRVFRVHSIDDNLIKEAVKKTQP